MAVVTRNWPQSTDQLITALGFGKHNIIFLLILCASVFIFSVPESTYKFAVHDAQYRCYIAECDDETFKQEWLWHAIPFHHGRPRSCERYQPLPLQEDNRQAVNETCPRFLFNQSATKFCTKWVFGERHSVIQDFEIPCQEAQINLFHFVGALGMCISSLFHGLLSDKFGRKIVLMASCLVSSVAGFASSFSPTYNIYLVLHFLNTVSRSGAFSSASILCFESSPADHRILSFSLLHACRIFANLFLGVIAMGLPDWRLLYQVTQFPNIFNMVILLFIDESLQWSLLRKTNVDPKKLKQILKANKTRGSEEFNVYLHNAECEMSASVGNGRGSRFANPEDYKVKCLWLWRRLPVRWAACSACFATAHLMHNNLSGLIFHDLGYDIHLNFVVTNCFDLLGVILFWAIMDKLGARLCAVASLGLCFAACLILAIVDDNKVKFIFMSQSILHIIITVMIASISFYDLQMSPSTHRHTVFSLNEIVSSSMLMLSLSAAIFHCYIFYSACCFICGAILCVLTDITGAGLFDTVAQSKVLIKERVSSTLKKSTISSNTITDYSHY